MNNQNKIKKCKFCNKLLDTEHHDPKYHDQCVAFIKYKINYFKEYSQSRSIDLDFQIKHWTQFLKYIKR